MAKRGAATKQKQKRAPGTRIDPSKMVVCTICQRPLTASKHFANTLLDHAKRHLDMKQYVCSCCDRSCVGWHECDKHIQLVHPDQAEARVVDTLTSDMLMLFRDQAIRCFPAFEKSMNDWWERQLPKYEELRAKETAETEAEVLLLQKLDAEGLALDEVEQLGEVDADPGRVAEAVVEGILDEPEPVVLRGRVVEEQDDETDFDAMPSTSDRLAVLANGGYAEPPVYTITDSPPPEEESMKSPRIESLADIFGVDPEPEAGVERGMPNEERGVYLAAIGRLKMQLQAKEGELNVLRARLKRSEEIRSQQSSVIVRLKVRQHRIQTHYATQQP
ncbi:unnamed protein product, partial [Mesorhabditis spiculigera]